jgi:hypothetical protein
LGPPAKAELAIDGVGAAHHALEQKKQQLRTWERGPNWFPILPYKTAIPHRRLLSDFLLADQAVGDRAPFRATSAPFPVNKFRRRNSAFSEVAADALGKTIAQGVAEAYAALQNRICTVPEGARQGGSSDLVSQWRDRLVHHFE